MQLPGADTRVVELRVPGVRGMSGNTLLDAVASVEVGGDGLGKIVRPADRLRRPAPGPTLQAEGRTMPRTLEGYQWNAMTSGGIGKATWALLFPFSLANIVHWMLPPVPEGSRAARGFAVVCRGLLRLAGLLLTMLFSAQLAVVSLNMLAAQCLAADTGCLTAVPDWVRQSAPLRAALGLLPLLLVVGYLHRVAKVSWPVRDVADTRADAPRATRSGPAARLPGDNLTADPDTPTLRGLHTMAALAVITLLTVGGPLRIPETPSGMALWYAAAVILVVAVLGTALLDDPRSLPPRGASRVLRAVLNKPIRRTLLTLAALSALTTPALPDPLTLTPRGSNATVEVIAAALLGTCALFAIALIPAAVLGKASWAGLPRQLRAWVGGWAAAPMLALAGLLGGGFGAGLAIALRQLIGTDQLRLPDGYQTMTLLWGLGAALGVLIGGVLALATLLIRWRRQRTGRGAAEVRLLHEEAPVELPQATRAWRQAGWERRHAHQVVLGISIGLSIGVGIALAMRLRGIATPAWADPLAAFGVAALGFLAAGLLRSVYVAATNPRSAPHLRILADLVGFWPRQAHPIAPPCYALKVIPELAARAREHLREPNTRVVLVGDSLGGVLAVIAAARLVRGLPEEQRERLGVVTAGAPLQWAYSRAFPSVVPPTAMAALYGALDGRLHALCRGSDPFGGAVTSWQRQVVANKLLGFGYRRDGTVGPLPAGVRGAHGALIIGGDHWLPDPQPAPVAGRRWAPGVLRHTDYSSDPEWDDAVAMAAGLRPAVPENSPTGEQTQLFGLGAAHRGLFR
ncbi:lipase (class 3) [Tamaricihabitans halophyticus]|uniref:Lipase (Class 3) n=1 Tax=Tamaricihabitans halophyticus TaxID=1262583 RepID=A0A4R2QJ01_9PSEU|nr:hypothetical protein [Tamaricihabitans halophyticus]TCP49227.1 lipase (class 3) [Tamaricihabitans halophyticus]